ncbi:MAG: DUF4276 family protein [Anaerolineae bacterium]|nr:DUF4276 family protein [Anaerolineae bacterium]
MNKVLISVEGATEERFVTEILQSLFAPDKLWLQPVFVKTRQNPDRPDDKGGYVPYERVRRQLRNLLGDTSAIAVTTMYDFYALPPDYPGVSGCPDQAPLDCVQSVEQAWQQDINHTRFYPYLQLHEFEALIFVDVETANRRLDGSQRQLDQLHAIRAQFANPEHINDDPRTAPSRRLRTIYPAYQKVLDGIVITAQIGLERLRAACPHFNTWVAWLASLQTKGT